MKKLEKFLTSPPTPLLKGEGSIDEVVINDYGVLHMVHEQFPTLQIIWGNFLSGQNKDPYLKDFVDKSEHRHLSIDSAYYSNLFKEYGVQNIELYNVFQGMEI
ncbi:MAG: hypothetical protein H6767_02805 [Candidatus Peribacteria bacterium]|nr:MAG: hypothetical protein H6767_02805 [Candidatus Peribacteria bacterium]